MKTLFFDSVGVLRGAVPLKLVKLRDFHGNNHLFCKNAKGISGLEFNKSLMLNAYNDNQMLWGHLVFLLECDFKKLKFKKNYFVVFGIIEKMLIKIM